MKIERIRIEGFGALRDLDIAWPEGRVLLAVDPNETGKTTLCEAIVAAPYRLARTRGLAGGGGGRVAFGETVTGGLTEELFRATAYVSQNVLDRESLDAGLTVELARIADSGGGEASVVRALKSLDAVRAEMPEPAAGAKISVDTEIARLGRRREIGRASGRGR